MYGSICSSFGWLAFFDVMTADSPTNRNMPPSHHPTDAYPLSATVIATDLPFRVKSRHWQHVPFDDIMTVGMMQSNRSIDARLPASKQVGTQRTRCVEVNTEEDSEIDLQCTETKHTTRCKCGNVISWNEANDQKNSSFDDETFQTNSSADSHKSSNSQIHHGEDRHVHTSRKTSVFNRLYHYGFKQEKKRRKLVVAVTEERNKELTFSPRINSPRRQKKNRNKCADSAKHAYLNGQLCGECVMKVSVGKGELDITEKNRASIQDSHSRETPIFLNPPFVDATINLAPGAENIHVSSPLTLQETQSTEVCVEFDESQFTDSIAARQCHIRQELAAVPSYIHVQSFDCHYFNKDDGSTCDQDECYFPYDEILSNDSTCDKEIRDGAEDEEDTLASRHIDSLCDAVIDDATYTESCGSRRVSSESFAPDSEAKSHEQGADDAFMQTKGRFACNENDDRDIIGIADRRMDCLNEFGEALPSTPSVERMSTIERKDELHFPASFQQTEPWDETIYASQVSFESSNTISQCGERCHDGDIFTSKERGRDKLHYPASFQETKDWDEMTCASQVSFDSSSTISKCDECCLRRDSFNHEEQGLLSDETKWKNFLSSCKNTEGIEVMMITPETKKCLIIVPSHLNATLEEDHDAAIQNERVEEDDNPIGSILSCNFLDSIEGICSRAADAFERHTCNCGDFRHAWNNSHARQIDEYKFGIDPFEEFLVHSSQIRMY